VIPSKRPVSTVLARPSTKELWGKLTEAKHLVQNEKWAPAMPEKLQACFDELEELGIETALPEDQKAIFMMALSEIRADHYAGSRPPMRSYEPATSNLEMFAFRWESIHFNCCMYFKFSLGGADKGRRVWMFSIHPNRDEHNAD
jgi:hypothetical protein